MKRPYSCTPPVDGRGFWLVVASAALFHLCAFLYVRDFYAHHLPHYDSMGAYAKMFRIIDLFREQGFIPALQLAASHHLSWLHGFFALIGAPFLSKTPQSLQLYNSLCVFLFMVSVYWAARSFGAGEGKAYLLSLIVFLPDTFYNWSGGILDLQRDPAFIALLGAAYFSFFAYVGDARRSKALFMGLLAGLAVLSRGNAVYVLAVIMGPPILIWILVKLKDRGLGAIKELLFFAGSAFLSLALPNVYFTISRTNARYLDPYTCYAFVNDPWRSLHYYWTMPFKIMFGRTESPGTFLVTLCGLGIITVCLGVLCVLGRFRVNRQVLFGRVSNGLAASGVWVVVANLLLVCFALRFLELPYEESKYPFYPSLLFFLSLFFISGLAIVRGRKPFFRRWHGHALAVGFMGLIMLMGSVRVAAYTPKEPPEHAAVARNLTHLFSKLGTTGTVAFIWHDTISLDTLKYYQAQEGLPETRKFFFTAPDGSVLDFAVGTPPNADVGALLATMKDQIERGAAFVVVNAKPNAYSVMNPNLFIFKYGQPVIDQILKENRFKEVYRYQLWRDRPWSGEFVVLENMTLG